MPFAAQPDFNSRLTAFLFERRMQFTHPGLAGGGVSRGFDRRELAYEYAYTEITGYALSCLLDLDAAGRADQLAAARAYLLEVQHLADGSADAGAFCHSVDPQSGAVRREYYSFDAAMCVQGLADLHAASGDGEALAAAERGARWLVERAQLPDGSFRAVIVPGGEDEAAARDVIFGDQGVLHAKHAIGLLKVWRAGGEERYRAAARAVCDWALGLQNPDGSFRASPRSGQTASHTHCYAVEGLLYAGHCLGEERYQTAARRAGDWLARRQNRSGSLNIAYNRPPWTLGRRVVELVRPLQVGDATAQTLRIWLLLDAAAGESRYAAACARAMAFLRRAQVGEPADPRALGGIEYWPGHPMLFAWVGMFALQAARWLEDDARDHARMIESLF